MPNLPTIEQMLKAGMHFGHRTSKWHPKMAPYIFGQRGGVHIFDLAKTTTNLEQALDFVRKFAAEGKTILFVGTKLQVRKPLKELAEATQMPYMTNKWLGGALTNFAVIKKAIKRYRDLIEDRDTGKLAKYTKKERLEIDREIARLEFKVGGIATLTRLPDAIFIWDIKQELTAFTEARKKNIPIIALCDTNVNPTGVNYVIPGNDDATKTIKLVLGLIGEAIAEGRAAKAAAVPVKQQ